MRTTLVAIFLSCSAPSLRASTKDTPPTFALMGCAEEAAGQGEGAEGLAMECRGKPPYSTVDCTFTSVVVLGGDSDTKKKRAELIAAVAKQSVAEREAMIAKACADMKGGEGILAAPKGTLSVRRIQQRALDRMRQLCACRNQHASCLTGVMLKSIDDEERTCTIHVSHFEGRFQQVSAYRWMNTPGPEGVCDVVNVEILEREPKHDSLWTYRLKPTVGNPGASPFCKGLGAKECTWKLPSAAAMECATVQFGY
jgi:hypothetical protein